MFDNKFGDDSHRYHLHKYQLWGNNWFSEVKWFKRHKTLKKQIFKRSALNLLSSKSIFAHTLFLFSLWILICFMSKSNFQHIERIRPAMSTPNPWKNMLPIMGKGSLKVKNIREDYLIFHTWVKNFPWCQMT